MTSHNVNGTNSTALPQTESFSVTTATPISMSMTTSTTVTTASVTTPLASTSLSGVALPDKGALGLAQRIIIAPGIVCGICGDTFGRHEHLTRHLRCHTAERPFGCPVCHKRFSRSDTLRRHLAIHTDSNDSNGAVNQVPNKRSLTARVSHACHNCFKLKIRCDGEKPCFQCRDRSVSCEYYERARKRHRGLVNIEILSSGIISGNHVRGPLSIISGAENDHDSGSGDDETVGALSEFVKTSPACIGGQGGQWIESPEMVAECQHEPEKEIPNQVTGAMSMAPLVTDIPQLCSGFEAHSCITNSPELQQFNPPFTQQISSSAIPLPESSMGRVPVGLTGIKSRFPQCHPVHEMHPPMTDRNEICNSGEAPEGQHYGNLNTIFFGEEFYDFPPNRTSAVYLASSSNTSPATYESCSTGITTPFTPLTSAATFPVMQPSAPLSLGGNPVAYSLSSSAPSAKVASSPDPVSQFIPVVNFGQKQHNQVTLQGMSPEEARLQCFATTTAPSVNEYESHGAFSDQDAQSLLEIAMPPSITLPNIPVADVCGRKNSVHLLHVPPVPEAFHTQLHTLWCQSNRQLRPLQPMPPINIPPLNVLNTFVQLYFEHFHPLLPFLHVPSFDPSKTHWLLTLAVACVGSRYFPANDRGGIGENESGNDHVAFALQELLKRGIRLTVEFENTAPQQLWLTQACLLHEISIYYSSDKKLMENGNKFRCGGIAQLRRKRCLKEACMFEEYNEVLETMSLEKRWRLWVMDEERRRLGFGFWLLDCWYAMHFDMWPMMGIGELLNRLPCSEDLWGASTAEAWSSRLISSQRPPRMPFVHDALKDLYVYKSVSLDNFGDLARLVLVQAVFRTCWDAKQYHSLPFRVPSAEKENITYNVGSVHDLSKIFDPWKMEAMTALDILTPDGLSFLANTAANRTDVFATSPLNITWHLYTHITYIYLHAPLKALRTMAGWLSTRSVGEMSEAEAEIEQWVNGSNEDGGTGVSARIAVLHAGRVYSIIRSWPSNAFYEPIALFYSGLVLWAYGKWSRTTKGPATTCPQHTGNHFQQAANTGEGSLTYLGVPMLGANEPFSSNNEYFGGSQQGSNACPGTFQTIQLDCPDPLVVPQFYTEGEHWKPLLVGVGSICEEGGPDKVLREVSGMLSGSGLGAWWSMGHSFANILGGLLGRSEQAEGLAREEIYSIKR